MEEMTLCEERIALFLEDLRERPDSPLPMSNKGYVEEVCAAVMEEYPEAVIIEDGWMQWIAATPDAKKKLIQQLKGKAGRLVRDLATIQKNIMKLI